MKKEKQALEALQTAHAFNTLTNKMVDNLSLLYGIDCVDLCNKYGITYNIV